MTIIAGTPEEPTIWMHSINEIESEIPWYKRQLSQWFHKRWFIYFQKFKDVEMGGENSNEVHRRSTQTQEVNVEISTGFNFAIKYQHGEASDHQASSQIRLALFFFTIYISWCMPERWYFHKKCIATWDNNREFNLVQGREYGFYFHDWSWVWSFHSKIHESSSRDPWWMRQYIVIPDVIWGQRTYKKNDPQEFLNEAVVFPEKTYHLGVKLSNDTWTRPRWPFWPMTKTVSRADIEVVEKGGIPIPGKGENSWDCGDNATYGLCCPARTLEDAKMAMINSVYRTRSRYGSGPEMYRKAASVRNLRPV